MKFYSRRQILCAIKIPILLALLAGSIHAAEDQGTTKSLQTSDMDSANHFQVPPPPFTEGIFPCMDCHSDIEPDPERRELLFHEDIVLKHDEEHRWCLDCHDEKDRNSLHLANGSIVPFDESYRLCGQCHGDKLRSWKAGVHGKRMGMWNGSKTYLLCAHCHDPHQPAFKPIRPLPAPVSPDDLRESLKKSYDSVASLLEKIIETYEVKIEQITSEGSSPSQQKNPNSK